MSLFNFEGKRRRGRPHPVVPGAAASRPARAVRRRAANSRCATPTASASTASPDEVGEVIGKIIKRSAQAGRSASRAMPTEQETDTQDPARRVRAGRHLVSHRRPDAQGRATAISISSTASATRSAGRARTCRPPRSRRRSRHSPASWRPTSMASRSRATTAAPAWRRWWSTGGFDLDGVAPAHLPTQLPDYARPLFLRIRRRDGRHRHVQAEEDRSGARRLRSRARPAIRSISTIRTRKAFVPARSGALSARSLSGRIGLTRHDDAARRAGVLARGGAGSMV